MIRVFPDQPILVKLVGPGAAPILYLRSPFSGREFGGRISQALSARTPESGFSRAYDAQRHVVVNKSTIDVTRLPADARAEERRTHLLQNPETVEA